MINIDWDDEKAEINLQNHRLDFLDALLILDGFHILAEAKAKGGEERMLATGLIFDICATVVFTMRGDTHRIISLRPASDKERSYFYAALHQR